jgi:uncharacterized membrane protein YkoI
MNAARTVLLVLWLAAGAWTGAWAANAAPAPHCSAHEVSMEQAVKVVERQYRARVVKAEMQKSGARTTYVFKLLNDSGKVWTVHFDAATGAVQ